MGTPISFLAMLVMSFFALPCRRAYTMESMMLAGQLIQLLSRAFIGNTKLLCVKNNLSPLNQNHVKRGPCTTVSPGSPVRQMLVTQCPAGECGVLLAGSQHHCKCEHLPLATGLAAIQRVWGALGCHGAIKSLLTP